MEKEYKCFNKQAYKCPEITRVELDNEISLALESSPPFLPGEELVKAPDYFKNDPFHTV